MHTDARYKRDDEESKKRYYNMLAIKKHCESQNKIFVLILSNVPDRAQIKYFKELVKDGFIVYSSIRKTARAFMALHDYGRRLRKT